MNKQTLYKYRKDCYSQNGEDGVIEEILKRLNVKNGFCVEFGAWDGKYLSNTYHLVKDCGWKGLHIESDPDKFAELMDNPMVVAGNITPVKAYVALEGESMLDRILAKHNVPKNFELLSIDIDGEDLNVWKTVTAYRPQIVIIEIDSSIEPTVLRVLPDGRPEKSFANMLKLGQEKGYTLVCHTGNMFFVLNELAGRLGIDEELNDPISLFCDKWKKKRQGLLYRFLRKMARFVRKAFSSKIARQ